MMKVIETPISPFLQNAPIAFCEETRESIFIDPGDEIERLIDASSSNFLNQNIFVLRTDILTMLEQHLNYPKH